MSRTFYPSDEYDGRDLEFEAKRRTRFWFGKERRQDDDDDPPPTPVSPRHPRPLAPASETMGQAA